MHDHGATPYDKAHWDALYAADAQRWSGRVNATLAATVAHLPPGRALDVGCGEGADAIWLAERGWQVLGVDISDVAVERARAAASAAGVVVEVVQGELPGWSPEPEAFDLVAASFLQLPAQLRPPVWKSLVAAVRPAGHLVVIAHDPSDPHVAGRLEEMGDRLFDAAEVVDALGEGWEIGQAGPRRRDGHPGVDLVVDAIRRCS